DQNHVINVICPHSGSLLTRHPFDQHKHQLSHNHSIIIDTGSDRIHTATKDEPLEESNRQVNATVIHLRESINHLKEVNKDIGRKLTTSKRINIRKQNKQNLSCQRCAPSWDY
ncbi:MAG: hypothetical protein WAM14_02190, partial [Candidatus Nitrosopolaris sp.]